jgi:hypothetical protein
LLLWDAAPRRVWEATMDSAPSIPSFGMLVLLALTLVLVVLAFIIGVRRP